MEPNLPAPHGSPEQGPVMPQPERQPLTPVERQPRVEQHDSREQKTGHGAGENQVQQTVTPITTAPIPQMPDPIVQAAPQIADDTPSVAADDDVIEKEWVEKAKKVIAETRHDPFLQEQAVSRLQADYLQKRYGKSVKLPEEG